MSYRPITDVWILARPKVKYYGAYPNGFLERALPLVGIGGDDACMHLCSGRVTDYPNQRLVEHAYTADSDASLEPDVVVDLAQPVDAVLREFEAPNYDRWRAVLIDPPYTEDDHAKYDAGGKGLPTANHLLRVGLNLVRPGGRVGVLHYVWPQPPKTAKSIAAVAVFMGFNNRARVFSVYERIAGEQA